MVQNHGGEPLGPSWGQWGPIGSKKWVQTVKNYHAAKFEFWTTPRSSIFRKNGSYGYGAKSRWGPPRVHLGANGVPLGKKKWAKTVKKLQCRNIRILDDPAVIDFSQKIEVTVMAPNHGGDPLGSILGSMGSHWVQKMGQNRKNYHAPKFEFSTTPLSSIFRKKWKLRLWRQIMVGTS